MSADSVNIVVSLATLIVVAAASVAAEGQPALSVTLALGAV